jgi:glycosyl transferase family 25
MIKKYVINLKRRNDRLEIFKNQCPYKDIETIEAFDGKYIDNNKNKDLFYKIKNHKNSYDITNSEIGCFVSHMTVWKKIIDSNTKYNLIFEDDTIFSDNFKTELDKVELDKYIENFLYVGGRHEPNFIMDNMFTIDIADNLIKYNLNTINKCDQHFRGAFGYLITKKFAEILYYSFDFLYDGLAVDHYIYNSLSHYKIDIMNTKPLLCYSHINADDSDIRYENGKRK